MPNDINFQDEDPLVPKTFNSNAKPSMGSVITSFVISTGIVKTQRGAEYVMIGLVVVLFVAAIAIQILSAPHPKESQAQINFEIQQMNAEHPPTN
jgi:hypothetical protein